MLFARGANAVCGTDDERKQASIRKAIRSLIDPFTQRQQIAVECAIVASRQFHVDRCGVARDGAQKLEERKQTLPTR